MKKLNTTYLDSLVSKILKETLEEKADTLVSKIKGDVCECGGQMYEGECKECGNMYENMSEGIYDVEDIDDSNEFDYVGESEDFVDDEENTDEDREKTCRYHIENFGKEDPVTKEMCQGINITEALKGRQRKLDKNKNNKIDAEDFKMLRNKSKSDKDSKKVNKVSTRHGMEEQETDEGNAFSGALANAKKSGKDSFEVDGKKYPVKESYRLTESEMVGLIEKIVLEQKNKEVKDPAEKNNIKGFGGSPRGLEVYKKAHNGSGKENDDNIKAVTKKMKDYLKDGSKGDYEMNPKMFPKGNGEIEKMKKKAYTMSDAGQEFIDDFMSPGMENLDYDQIEPNEEQITNNIEGSSKTGNNSEWGNAVETDVNKKINAKRKANKFAKVRNMAYQKSAQPIKDATGEDSGKGINLKLESTEKKTKQINEEFDRMKSLISYDRKTQ
jgi:hypothetical protein